jgi:hypothetical protein
MLHFIRKILLFSLLIAACGCSGRPGSANVDIIPESTDESPAAGTQREDELAVFKQNLIDDYQSVLGKMENATRYQIDLQIADTVSDVSGHQEVLYTNNEEVPLDEIYFRLFPNISGLILTVTNLTVNGTQLPAILTNKDTALRVDLPIALQPGGQVLIAMDFRQQVPREMGGNYGLNIYMDDILALDQFFPIIPVYDEDGWEVQDPPINADMLFADEAFFRVRVNAPAGLVLAGSGIEVGSTNGDQRQEVIYIGGPQRDFFLAASPRFESVSRKVGGTTITAYFPGEYRQAGNLVLETAERALNSYNDRFGAYPYIELDLISTPMNAGGMEYSTATSLSLRYFDADSDAANLTFLEAVVAHEVAHQWFFNQVMSDQLQEPWLDEALVQYATYLYYVDRYGVNNAQGFVQSWYQRWANVDQAPIPIGKPAGAYTREEYGPIIYGRGPLFFEALNETMGEASFNRLLSAYADQYRWGIADSQAFTELAQEICDCDLSDLLAHWVKE